MEDFLFNIRESNIMNSAFLISIFRLLNDSFLEEIGVAALKGYKDPKQQRELNSGEIGCFLSHYFTWEEVKSTDTLCMRE